MEIFAQRSSWKRTWHMPAQQCRPQAGSGPQLVAWAAPLALLSTMTMNFRSIDGWANLARSRALASRRSNVHIMKTDIEHGRVMPESQQSSTTTHSIVASSLVAARRKTLCAAWLRYTLYTHIYISQTPHRRTQFAAHASAGLGYLWLCANAHRRFMECVAVARWQQIALQVQLIWHGIRPARFKAGLGCLSNLQLPLRPTNHLTGLISTCCVWLWLAFSSAAPKYATQ